MKTLLLDGDELAYKISLKYQHERYSVVQGGTILCVAKDKKEAIEFIGNDKHAEIISEKVIDPNPNLEEDIETFITGLMSKLSCSSLKLCLSGENNFRYKIATLQPYKGKRDDSTKPYYLPEVRKLLFDRGGEGVDFLEADDLLTYYSTVIPDHVLASSDKDLRTVPSINFSILKDELKVITPELSRYNFAYQLLVGDPVDNIPSPYSLGPVSANNILASIPFGSKESEYNQLVVNAYFDYLNRRNKNGECKTHWYTGQPIEEVLYEIGNLLWMHRTLDPGERWTL